jgi:hypothetical protein
MTVTSNNIFSVMVSLVLTTLTGCPKKAPPAFLKAPPPVFLTDPPDFKQGPKDGADWVYIKEGIDFKSYNKLMMDYIKFYFKEDVDYKGIQTRELADTFHKAMVEALGDAYPLVAEPGPDVLRFRVAITDLIPSKLDSVEDRTLDLMSGVETRLKKGSLGKQLFIGEASIEAELLDSQTNERLAAAMDTKVTKKYEVYVGRWEQVEKVFKFWAKRLRHFLDKVHGKKQ